MSTHPDCQLYLGKVCRPCLEADARSDWKQRALAAEERERKLRSALAELAEELSGDHSRADTGELVRIVTAALSPVPEAKTEIVERDGYGFREEVAPAPVEAPRWLDETPFRPLRPLVKADIREMARAARTTPTPPPVVPSTIPAELGRRALEALDARGIHDAAHCLVCPVCALLADLREALGREMEG